MKDIMVDIETFGTQGLPVVLTVGLCPFDTRLGTVGTPAVIGLNYKDQFRSVCDPDTVMWWLRQSEEARANITGITRLPLVQALINLRTGLEQYERVWAKGTDFDLRILQNMYETYVAIGWESEADLRLVPFWKWRDCRAFYDLPGLPARNPYLHPLHDAGADAAWQAHVVVEQLKRFK